VLITENERAELHDTDEAGEVENLGVRIAAVEYAGKIEQFSTLINLRPETLLERFFSRAKGRSLFDEIEVGQDTDDFWKPMRL